MFYFEGTSDYLLEEIPGLHPEPDAFIHGRHLNSEGVGNHLGRKAYDGDFDSIINVAN